MDWLQVADVLILTFSALFILWVLLFWSKRWLYFHTFNMPGPQSLPFIGGAYLLRKGPEEALNLTAQLINKYSPICKLWLGRELMILTGRTEDVEEILQRNPEKSDFYDWLGDVFKKSILIAPVNLWKERRKMINPSFNLNVVNSFVPKMCKTAKELNMSLKQLIDEKELCDFYPKLMKFTLDAVFENLANVNADLVKDKEKAVELQHRYENILLKRFFTPLYHFNFLWKHSALGKESAEISQWGDNFVERLITMSDSSPSESPDDTEEERIEKKKLLKHLLELRNSNKLTHEGVLEEFTVMISAGSETTAVVLSSVLMVLGLYPDVQEKIYQELDTIFEGSDRDITLEDTKRMDYLERVIKETMRLMPPVPLFARKLSRDYFIEPYVLPKGANMVFILSHLHQRPDIWPDPLKFDPDRFLPEETEKRSRYAYIPFSYGPRNCIGYRYALLSMKIFLASMMRKFKVIKTLDYKSIEEIEYYFAVVAVAKKGYRVLLEERKNIKTA